MRRLSARCLPLSAPSHRRLAGTVRHSYLGAVCAQGMRPDSGPGVFRLAADAHSVHRSPRTTMRWLHPRRASSSPIPAVDPQLERLESAILGLEKELSAVDLKAIAVDARLQPAISRLDLALGAIREHTRAAEPIDSANATQVVVPSPAFGDLRIYGFRHSIPFVFFGFFDNFIMIMAGDLIEASICVKFGWSTMCAAAMGNTISDICGLWLGNTVEAQVHRFGLPIPALSDAQKLLPLVQFTKMLGMVAGCVFGCVLGMFPLAWPHQYRLWDSVPRG